MRDTCDWCGGDLNAKVDDDAPPVYCSHFCYDEALASIKADLTYEERKQNG